MSDAAPLRALRLRTPRLELRLASEDELRALARVARAGVHDPGEMPFAVAWTDNTSSPSFEDDFVAFHRERLASATPEHWRLELITFLDAEPIGSQGIGADDFAAKREVVTGSWLGRAWQGQGLGTEQRSAVLTLAFEGLGASAAVSSAWEGNYASLGVSRSLGYVPAGTTLAYPRGEPVPHTVLRLDAAAFRPAGPVEIEGLDAVRSILEIPR